MEGRGPESGADGAAHVVSPATRATMRANKRRDTKPELALRRLLHAAGYRYRVDYRIDLPDGSRVRPDIVFTKRRVAVFVDGCFWHGCPEHGTRPKTNQEYWGPKLARNVERDRRNTLSLQKAGWSVARIWEHEGLARAYDEVLSALTPDASP